MKAGDRIIVTCNEKHYLKGMRGVVIRPPCTNSRTSLVEIKLYGYKNKKDGIVTLYRYRIKLMPTILKYQIC